MLIIFQILLKGNMKIFSVLTIAFFLFARAEALNIVDYESSFSPYPCNLLDRGKVFKSLYQDYVDNLQVGDEYIIPKIIHAIWLGSELPERCKKMIASWKKFHPEWIVKVWTDSDTASFDLQNQAAFDRANNYGEKSDIFRYEILYRYGGLYVDTDFECLQPFDELHKSCEFYAGQNHAPVELLIGIIGSVPGHPILKACIDNVRVGNGDSDFWRILETTGPIYFSRVFLSSCTMGNRGMVVPFPPSYFYPMPNTQRERKDIENVRKEFIKSESLAIHWWDASWADNP